MGSSSGYTRARRGAPTVVLPCLLLTIAAILACAIAPPSSRADGGSARITANQATAMLSERVRAIHAETPPSRYPLGSGRDGVLHFARGWTSGFWAGTLWRASDLNGGEFGDWATTATLRHLGHERTDTHDLGFMYGDSSVAAYERLCPDSTRARLCRRLKRSGLTAARTLLSIARSARATGMIPTRKHSCSDCLAYDESETIIDSMMNLHLLSWATRMTGRQRYRETARRHAIRVAELLQRSDGSTAQAVEVSRVDGSVTDVHTHQGVGDTSTWARGQAWSIYGFATAGAEFESARLLGVAERNAAYVADHLPVDGVPLWDFDALPGSPIDVSAGVITAAGLFKLAEACDRVTGACTQRSRWVELGKRMLDAALANVNPIAPVGFLGNQVYTFGGRDTWDDDGELVFGLYYAFEAIELSRRFAAV
ncbi:MAG: glycoside hydrolase family 88 protein [Actinobacteria bacterium]|nr:glycoside hydrolase family 88 protein [Actinomycetota bacterium]